MPTINDATVIASGSYDTSGNGGRKLVRLDNGWIVATATNTSSYVVYVFVCKPDINNVWSWSQVCLVHDSTGYFSVNYPSIVSNGNDVYLILSNNGHHIYSFRINVLVQTNVNIWGNRVAIDSSGAITDSQYSAINPVVEINKSSNELHVAWQAKNAAYPNSFNIRYAKGTINADGSVTWGAVEQITTFNISGIDITSPSISIKDTNPSIIGSYSQSGTSFQYIYQVSKIFTTRDTELGTSYVKSGWGSNFVHKATGNYTQSSPSAIFIPQEIAIKNPLFASATQGVIAVSWQGWDSVTTANNIRFSYSLDGGVTWSAMQKITTSTSINYNQPSITADKNGFIYIVCDYAATTNSIRVLSNKTGTWVETIKVSGNGDNPSTLYDLSVNFTEPLFIYKDVTNVKVGFYGTWTVTTISVTQGTLGIRSDKSNLLTYAITTDGAMSEVIEKVNGAEVGRKTPTSGQSLTVGLTQAQWDSVRFGKYSDFNTISISLLENDWEQGTYSGASGNPNIPSNSTTQLRLKKPIQVKGNARYNFAISSGYNIFPIEVDSNDIVTYKGTGWLGTETYTTKPNTTKLYIVIRKSDDSTINVNSLAIGKPSITTVDSMVNNNTLTIEMGSEKWTYTFDKRLASDSDILSAVKATQDAQNTYLPAVKSKLASAVRGKGGTVNDTDSFETMVSAVGGIPLGVKKATGTINGTGTTTLTRHDGNSVTVDYVAFNMANIPFVPRMIEFRFTDAKYSYFIGGIWYKDNHYFYDASNYANAFNGSMGYRSPYVNGVVNIPIGNYTKNYTWIAYE